MAGYSFAIQDSGARFTLQDAQRRAHSIEMRFLGGSTPRRVSGEEPLPGLSSYFPSPDESKWLRKVPHYGRVRLERIYPGVDVTYYGAGGRIEYDFEVAPGGDPGRIRLGFEGAESVRLTSSGDLEIVTGAGPLVQHKPVAFQTVRGQRIPVEARFAVMGGEVRFVVGSYDRRAPLVIDPTIVWSTYGPAGATVSNRPNSIAVDPLGAAYVVSDEGSVYKINPAGTAFSYIVSLSPGQPQAIAVDGAGMAYVTGQTQSTVPLKTPLQAAFGGQLDAFVTKINADGSDLIYSTYLGGADRDAGQGIAVNSSGAAYVAGYTGSTNFPATNAFQATRPGRTNMFLTKLNPAGSDYVFSTYYGGSAPQSESVVSLVLDRQGRPILIGESRATDIPLLTPLLNAPVGSVLSRFTPAGALDLATRLVLDARGVAVDSLNDIYLSGIHNSNQVTLLPTGPQVARLSANGSELSLVARLPGMAPAGIAVDPAGNLVVGGRCDNTFPLLRSLATIGSACLMKLSMPGGVLYAARLGEGQVASVAVDNQGSAYLTGSTNGVLATTAGAPNSLLGPGSMRQFVTKLQDLPDQILTTVTVGFPAPLQNVGLSLVVDGVTYFNSATLLWIPGSTHNISTATTQGTNNLRFRFQSWSDGGAASHTVTATASGNYTATFLAERRVTTDAVPLAGGTVTSSPAPSADGYLPANGPITFIAVPAQGYSFAGWTGAFTGTANPTSFEFSSNSGSAVIANFVRIPVPGVSLGFVPVSPCRLADTRPGEGRTGAFGPPLLTAGSIRDIPIPQGVCNIPASAKAYALNVTVVPLRPLSFLTVYPTGQARPNVSTLNAFQGQTVANAAIVPAGSNGAVSVFATDDTNVIIDINGYFTDSPDSLSFYPLTPCRVIDTRSDSGFSAGAFGAPSLVANVARNFTIPASNCVVPNNAQAYVMNFTVVPKGPLNYITTYPAGVARPFVSTLNSPQGRVLANAAIVPAGTNGAISIFSPDATDVIVDMSGYFAPRGAPGALRYYTLNPCRVADTRPGEGFVINGPPIMAAQESRDFPMRTSQCAAPDTAAAFSLNATVVPPGYLGFLTLIPQGATRPVASTLNAWEGQVAANAAIIPGRNLAITAFSSNATHLILDLNGYFAP